MKSLTCKECGCTKSLNQFRKNSRSKTGYDQICINCVTLKYVDSPNAYRGRVVKKNEDREQSLREREQKRIEMQRKLADLGLL